MGLFSHNPLKKLKHALKKNPIKQLGKIASNVAGAGDNWNAFKDVRDFAQHAAGHRTMTEKNRQRDADIAEHNYQVQQRHNEDVNRANSLAQGMTAKDQQAKQTGADAAQAAANQQRANLAKAQEAQNDAYTRRRRRLAAAGMRAGLNGVGDASSSNSNSGGWQIH